MNGTVTLVWRTIYPILCLLTTLLGPFQAMALDCSSEDIELTTQSQVDSFQADFGGGGICDNVTGYLRIIGSDIVDLGGLADIVSTGGIAIIDTLLPNLDGLSSLTATGQLWISENPSLSNLHGLINVSTISGGLGIIGNDELTDLEGLQGISQFAGGIHIDNNAALVNVNHLSGISGEVWWLSITDNQSLQDVDGLNGITAALRWFDVVGNTVLQNLDGLSGLTDVSESIRIAANPALTSIDGLASLASSGLEFVIQDNQSLAGIDGLASFTSCGTWLLIQDNPNLASIDGFSSLQSIGSELRIRRNPGLTSINGFNALTEVGEIDISGNENLLTINGFASVTGPVWLIEINDNVALANIGGFNTLTDVSHYVFMQRNDALTNVGWLSGVSSIGKSLELSENQLLKDISGLSDLNGIGKNLVITNNSSLSDCSPLDSLLDDVDDPPAGPGPGLAQIPDIGGDVSIARNAPGCNLTCEPVLTLNCPPSDDPQVWIDGFNVQVNGAVDAPSPCESVARLHWDWGDAASGDSWFPASHTYGEKDYFTISATALDASDNEIAHANCDISTASRAEFAGTLEDPEHDEWPYEWQNRVPDPDLVSSSVRVVGGTFWFTVQFREDSFGAPYTRSSIYLDIDMDPNTGKALNYSFWDDGDFGVDYLVSVPSYDDRAMAEVYTYVDENWVSLGYFPYEILSDGYSVPIPRSVFGNDEGQFNFRATASIFLGPDPGWGSSYILDYMPNASTLGKVLEIPLFRDSFEGPSPCDIDGVWATEARDCKVEDCNNGDGRYRSWDGRTWCRALITQETEDWMDIAVPPGVTTFDFWVDWGAWDMNDCGDGQSGISISACGLNEPVFRDGEEKRLTCDVTGLDTLDIVKEKDLCEYVIIGDPYFY